MLHNDISNRCYVKYSTITTEYSDTYSANLAKILSDTEKIIMFIRSNIN